MQNIQKNPMVTVAEAAAALNIDERTVRDKLSKEEWKGEKRMIGMKEKWFMYRGELERQLERLRIARPQERMSTQGLDDVFVDDSATAQAIDAQTVEIQESVKANPDLSLVIDQVLTKITEQFSKQLDSEKEVVFALRKELEEKDRQLRLLADFQRQAEEEHKAAELKTLEAEALRKQIAALQETKQQEEEARRILETENENLKQKAELAALSFEKLQLLEQQMQELKQPWWKKWFSAPASE